MITEIFALGHPRSQEINMGHMRNSTINGRFSVDFGGFSQVVSATSRAGSKILFFASFSTTADFDYNFENSVCKVVLPDTYIRVLKIFYFMK